jgi:ATP-dependent DNA helicase RecG
LDFRFQFSLIKPSIQLATSVLASSGKIVPVYRETKALTSRQVRKIILNVLPLTSMVDETIPESIILKLKLSSIEDSLQQIHCPDSLDNLNKARLRFQFEELFPLLLANEINKRQRDKQKSLLVPFDLQLAQRFVAKLPFKLTDDQRRVIWQIYKDIQNDKPMNRLVEGDVGSGKTVVAVMAAVMALAAGFKVAVMAPTELLAKQHAQTIEALLKPLEMEESLVLLTGSQSAKTKNESIDKANALGSSFVIGTHSLLSSGVDWHNLALIVIDEQHRFGVDQRMTLQKQAEHVPHFLSITATPIPRSLALTIFNDLSLSRLKEKPKNRQSIKSELISPSSFNRLVGKLKLELDQLRQIYIVCPYIHQKNDRDKIAAEYIFKTYTVLFKGHSVGLLHGQLPNEDQEKIMADFVQNKIQILVATTVIEVGVDVANASAMVIYGPEHFGLAQLHQLRGRVGRAEHLSFCYLMLSDSMEPLPRLRQFIQIQDGFRLSEIDLSIRGPGAIYGKLQHGKGNNSLLTLDDHELITITREAVDMFFQNKENLLQYDQLAKRVNEAQQITNLN